MCKYDVRSSKKNLSLSLDNVARVGHFSFHLVGILKHKCVYTQIFAHKKRYASSPLQYHFKTLTQVRCLPKHERARDRDNSRFGEQKLSQFLKSKIQKGLMKTGLTINLRMRLWKIRPRRTHRSLAQSFSSRETPSEN